MSIPAPARTRATSQRAVVMALVVDVTLTCGKLAAFVVTGSAALLAETAHSFADTLNQLLLWVGVVQSRRTADARHPYGFGRSRYVWALLSAAGVLFVGCGMALTQGVQQLVAPHPLHDLSWGLGVLGVSMLAESVSFAYGLAAVVQSARRAGVSVLHYLQQGDDPVAVAVVLEDGAAVLGAVIAFVAIGLAQITGQAAFDGAGSVAIGLLLGASAVFLINRNRRLLLDPSPPPEEVARIVNVLEQSPVVRRILDVKATQLGPDSVRFKAEIEFDGRRLARRVLARRDTARDWARLDGPADLEEVLVDFGASVVGAVGQEVDRVEGELAERVPEAHHVDLEPD